LIFVLIYGKIKVDIIGKRDKYIFEEGVYKKEVVSSKWQING